MFLAQAETTLQKAADKAVELSWFERLVPQREIRFVIYGTAILILVAIAVYLVMKVRDISTGQVATGMDHLTEFQDLHERGAFNDGEMSRLKETIKSNIGTDDGNKQQAPHGLEIRKPR